MRSEVAAAVGQAIPRIQCQQRQEQQFADRRDRRQRFTDLSVTEPAARGKRILDLPPRQLAELISMFALPDRVRLARGLKGDALDAVLDAIAIPEERAALIFQLATELPQRLRVTATHRVELHPIYGKRRLEFDALVLQRGESFTILREDWSARLAHDAFARELVEGGRLVVEELSDADNRAAAFRAWRETRPPRNAAPGWTPPLPDVP